MEDVDVRVIYNALRSSGRTFYELGPRFVLVSVVWFFCSLPLVTVGPATLGAYVAIDSLRRTHQFEFGELRRVLRTYFLPATLLTGVPLSFVLIASLYARSFVSTGSELSLLLVVITIYLAAYSSFVLIPTFIEIATGSDLETALRHGLWWTLQSPLSAVLVATITALCIIVTAGLTVAFVLVFAGFTFLFHLNIFAKQNSKSGASNPSHTVI